MNTRKGFSVRAKTGSAAARMAAARTNRNFIASDKGISERSAVCRRSSPESRAEPPRTRAIACGTDQPEKVTEWKPRMDTKQHESGTGETKLIVMEDVNFTTRIRSAASGSSCVPSVVVLAFA